MCLIMRAIFDGNFNFLFLRNNKQVSLSQKKKKNRCEMYVFVINTEEHLYDNDNSRFTSASDFSVIRLFLEAIKTLILPFFFFFRFQFEIDESWISFRDDASCNSCGRFYFRYSLSVLENNIFETLICRDEMNGKRVILIDRIVYQTKSNFHVNLLDIKNATFLYIWIGNRDLPIIINISLVLPTKLLLTIRRCN